MTAAGLEGEAAAEPSRQPADLAPLPEYLTMDAGSLPTVCIVTGELVGPFKNGGLGTSMTGLAELLGAFGADITVLYTGEVSPADLLRWRDQYARAGIRLEALSESKAVYQVGPIAHANWVNALSFYRTLRRRSFDVIHFNDTIGEGVYCLVAKRMGIAFRNTLLLLAVHSPTEWILEANCNEANWLGVTCYETAERISINATDVLWGPSRYLLDWIEARGYQLPKQVYVQQYVIPTGNLFEGGRAKCALAALAPPTAKARKPKEIVFFGRIEERKGIRLFAAAVTRIGEQLRQRGVSVLFLGKANSVSGVPADEFLRPRSAAWPFDWRIENSFDQRQAIAYLRDKDCVSVMASPVDNSPCTVYEALQYGIPFIAAATGGIPELVHVDDHASHLFSYTVDALCARILEALDNGVGIARPAVSVAENQARWLGMHAAWKTFLPAVAAKPKMRCYGVVIDHSAGAEALELTYAAVKRALGDQIAGIAVFRRDIVPLGRVEYAAGIVLVDELVDTSPAEVLARFTRAGADAVLVIRSGVDLCSGAAALFDSALGAGVDGALPFAQVGAGSIMPTLGASAAQSFLEGEFDPGGALFDLAAITRCLGANTEGLDRNRLYFGLIEEMQAADPRIWPLPEPVFILRDAKLAVVTLPGASIRNRTYARAPHRERNQMLATASYAYRHQFPTRTPVGEPGPVRVAVTNVVRRNARLDGFGRRVVTAIAGGSGVQTVKIILRRLLG